jgi:hypothetical protein
MFNSLKPYFLGLAMLAASLATANAGTITVSLPEFSGAFLDNSATYPQPSVLIGTFSYLAIPAGVNILSATVSGTFGNSSVNSTALENLFVGGVQVASCSSTGNVCFNPASPFDDPAAWSYTFTPAQYAMLRTGSVNFTVVQTAAFQVQEGITTLTINTSGAATPEPSTILLASTALLAIAFRRYRKPLLGLMAALVIPASGNAQVTWTATTTPVQATINGGPWNLNQGGPVTPPGPTTYCVNGVPLVNAPGVVNTMNPFYFPFVIGKGKNMQGYFDYRPRNINEATVAAKSTDGGLTWTFQQMAEQLTAGCPADNVNGSGNDNGQGHPYLLSFGGASWLYLLDRRGGHIDADGLLVHRLTPKTTAPLNPLPLTGSIYSVPPLSATIARWDFQNLPVAINNNPAPSIGTGTAKSLGMTNNYTYTQAAPNVGAVTTDDIEANPGSSDPAATNLEWRVRGQNPGNGWNLAAPQYSQGVEFDVSTVGYSNILLQFDWYSTNQGVRDLQVQYTADGTTWTNVGPLQIATPSGYNNQITINFGALGITSVNNNPSFGVRMVSAYDPTYTGVGAPTYTSATLTAGLPVRYNNNSGNWRFDEVNILTGQGGTISDPPVNTTGLINPDGILAAVNGTFPRQVLYIAKTLSGDLSFPTAQQCGLSSSGGKANHDVDQIRFAQTSDGINFTDLGPVNGLNDVTTVSNTAIRYVAPNGSLVKLPNGKYGLFYGGGNCLDGDSDGFHIIAYAESPDLLNWTIVNGINNPIASVAPVTVNNVTIPATTPVIGPTQAWFGGRVYNPNAIINDSGSINLIFAGYNAGYSADLTSYRNIGQVVLSSNGTTVQ